MRLILYIALLFNFLSFGQDVTGTWKGTLFQEGNKKYYFEIRVDEQDKKGNISGVTYVKESKSGNFGTISFTGTYKHKLLKFQEIEILKEDKDGQGYYTSNNFYWCIKNGTLDLGESDTKYYLKGAWQAKDDCPGGTLALQKDKKKEISKPIIDDEPNPLPGSWMGYLDAFYLDDVPFYIEIDSVNEDGRVYGKAKTGTFSRSITRKIEGTFDGKNFKFKETGVLEEDKPSFGSGNYSDDSEKARELEKLYSCPKEGTFIFNDKGVFLDLDGAWDYDQNCGTHHSMGGQAHLRKPDNKEMVEGWDEPIIEKGEGCDKLKSADFMLGAWRGKFKQHSCGVNNTYPMVVMIDSIDGMKFYGMFIWTNMQFARDSRSTLEGEIKDGKVYFLEDKIISGGGLVLHGYYKSEIINCDKLSGYWYRDYQSKVDCPSMKPYENGGDYNLDHYIIPTIYFDKNSSELRPKSKSDLDEFARFLKDFPSLKFNMSGNTDNTGSNAWNYRLSEKRAQMVIDYVVAKGISHTRFKYKFHGALSPAVENSSDENRQLNRRTEIKIKN